MHEKHGCFIPNSFASLGTVKSGNRRAMACAPHRDHRFEVWLQQVALQIFYLFCNLSTCLVNPRWALAAECADDSRQCRQLILTLISSVHPNSRQVLPGHSQMRAAGFQSRPQELSPNKSQAFGRCFQVRQGFSKRPIPLEFVSDLR